MIERIFVFSHNRGPLLKECVESIFRHFENSKVTIIDNRSDDPETIAVLSSLKLNATVITPDNDDGDYPHRELAWQSIDREEFFIFARDDTQFVRTFDCDDLNCARSFFYNNPNAAFLSPLFLQNRRIWDAKNIRLVDKFYSHYEYVIHENLKDRSVPMYFADTFIGRSSVLRNSDWSFSNESSTANAIEARKLYQKMGYMVNPVGALSPACSLTRNRRSIRCRIAKAIRRLFRVQRFRYRDLTPEEVDELRRRDPSILPFENRFLTRVDANAPLPSDIELTREPPVPKRL